MSTARKRIQTSETMTVGIEMAAAGGFMDAYSYLARGHVFANAQTGNMILLGIGLFNGDMTAISHYGTPILAFALGVAMAEVIRTQISKGHDSDRLFHWRQISVLAEMILLVCVSFLPQEVNLLANSLTSLACGIQVESFRKIHGNGAATTMCIGNLRSGTENLCRFIQLREPVYLKRTALYFGLILCFILGAVFGSFVIQSLALKAILVDAAILMIAFLIMFQEEKEFG